MDSDVSTSMTSINRQGRQGRRIIGGAVAAVVVAAAVVVGGTLQHTKAGTSGALGMNATTISITPSSVTISISRTMQPISTTATVDPTESGNVVTWTSSNTNYCTIASPLVSLNSSTVKVTCNKAGIDRSVVITASANKSITATESITITA
ncbi:MAG: hypothetical protein WCJ42_00900 [Actinomycetes bacterium]